MIDAYKVAGTSPPRAQDPIQPGRAQADPTPRFLTPAEVGAMLRLSRASAYRLASDLSFPCTRLGRTWRIEMSALERWLSSRTQRPGRRTTVP